jgi:hypothetical protein
LKKKTSINSIFSSNHKLKSAFSLSQSPPLSALYLSSLKYVFFSMFSASHLSSLKSVFFSSMFPVSHLSSQTARICTERFKNSSFEAILLQNCVSSIRNRFIGYSGIGIGFHLVPTIPTFNHSYFTLFRKFQNPRKKGH